MPVTTTVRELLSSRAKTMEESFFAKENEKVLEKLRQQAQRQARKETLATASGITDAALLDRLVELDLCAETLLALSLVPLVEVAWADGEIQDKERTAILAAAEEKGLAAGTPGYEMLASWLRRKPSAVLLETWREYVTSLRSTLDADALATLQEEILGRTRAVAAAAGGVLGLASISAAEKRMLADLEAAFTAG
jgi:hypothetical protein